MVPAVTVRNWSRTVTWTPTQRATPASVAEVVGVVDRCRRNGLRLRPIGSGHSFTPIAATDAVQIDLSRLTGVVAVDREALTARVRAGTPLGELGLQLAAYGVAQENLGDIDRQTIAGAVGTGTHGTGLGFGSLSDQVIALRIVTPQGEVVDCSREQRPDLFEVGRVSLGLVGVVTEITLRVVPAYRLRYRAEQRSLRAMLEEFDELCHRHRHVEFFWFPYSEWVQAKLQDVTEAPPTSRRRRDVAETMIENAALWGASEAARTFPRVSPGVGRLAGRLASRVDGVDASHRVFSNRRWVRFNEMEYALPYEAMHSAVEELRDMLIRRRLPIHFPVEVRAVRGDDIWLSPCHGRDTAFVAVHAYRGKPFREYFLAAEEIFLRHGGRPHWGKVHSLAGEELARLYPRWGDFLRVREEVDPDRMMLNSYLEQLLGL
jgi:FAD-linked oxidoreductase